MANWQQAALAVPNDPKYDGIAMPDNALAALKALVMDEEPVRILELGYGTGAATKAIQEGAGLLVIDLISLEQDKKLVKRGTPAKHIPTRRIYDADMLCPVVRYVEYPKGPWDMIVIDGPANPSAEPWVGGDIFHLRDEIKPGGVVFIQGRRIHVDYYQANLMEEFIFERMWSPNLTVMRKR